MEIIALLVLAGGLFFWALSPVFGKPQPIPQEMPKAGVRLAVERNLQEFRTDLDLNKMGEDDYRDLERELEETIENP